MWPRKSVDEPTNGFSVYFAFLKNDPCIDSSDAPNTPIPTNDSNNMVMKYSSNLKLPYIGFSTNLNRRLRQHNGLISGGAKKTLHGRIYGPNWFQAIKVCGFRTKHDALRFEYLICHIGWRKRIIGEKKKLLRLISLLSSDAKESGKDMFKTEKTTCDWEKARRDEIYLIVYPKWQMKLDQLSNHFIDVPCKRYSPR